VLVLMVLMPMLVLIVLLSMLLLGYATLLLIVSG
jgi:hypothetical protein